MYNGRWTQEEIESNVKLTRKAKEKAKANVDRTRIVNAAIAWGDDPSASVEVCHVHPKTDLAVFRVNNSDSGSKFVPVTFRGDVIEPGEMLCRAGYALLENMLVIKWDDANKQFVANGQPPLFANSGMVSRFIVDTEDGSTLIEVDSPGLKGQSGGPLFDAQGHICGMQIRTTHYPLGFDTGSHPGYYHVGQALSAGTLTEFLDAQGVAYSKS